MCEDLRFLGKAWLGEIYAYLPGKLVDVNLSYAEGFFNAERKILFGTIMPNTLIVTGYNLKNKEGYSYGDIYSAGATQWKKDYATLTTKINEAVNYGFGASVEECAKSFKVLEGYVVKNGSEDAKEYKTLEMPWNSAYTFSPVIKKSFN